jgi:hypothetical protein
MVISISQLTAIDISRPARALFFLRLTDYLLVIVCGNLLVTYTALPLVDREWRQAGLLILDLLVLVPVLLFLVYTGWKHVGVIDVASWRPRKIAFALLLLLSIFLAWGVFLNFSSIEQAFLGGYLVPLLFGGAIVGFWSLLSLRHMQIAGLGIPLLQLLRSQRRHRGDRAVSARAIKKINAPRGAVFGVLGGAILLGVILAPLPADPLSAARLSHSLGQISVLGYLLLLKAKAYFQVDADALLAVDKRRPILFLRWFKDDQRINLTSARSILDFSLEVRLSNHFTYFGPFVAIGSPKVKDNVPELGAARVSLSDAEWQPRVMDWMQKARIIVMYAGRGQWQTWELARVVNTEQTPKLILMFPEAVDEVARGAVEVKGWRRWFLLKRGDISRELDSRLELARQAFMNTKWSTALAGYTNARDVRAMLFRSDGSVIVIQSRFRNRDSYHLAALIAHYILLEKSTAMLVGIDGAVQGRRYPVDTDIFHVGASSDNNLVIKHDKYVSRRHALLRREHGQLWVVDEHSKNGTFVNGKRVGDTPAAVEVGDQIAIGKSILEVARADS